MGGLGSGARNRWASKTDEFHQLDLATFKRHWFEQGYSGTCRWSRGGNPTGSVGYILRPDHMRLHYSVTRQGEKQTIDERFDFAFTEQPFGGRRRWIICRSCDRRCRVLYGGRYFRCRRCYDATYASQYERLRLPGLAKADRVRDRLGGESGLAHAFPPKPKGMHWRTYFRLQAEDFATAERMERALYAWFRKTG